MAGETIATTALNPPYDVPFGGFFVPFSVAFATAALELADITEVGYLPAGTLLGFLIKATDMDTNVSPTLVQKLTVGTTDVVTAINYGQAATDGFRACTPLVLTAKTKLVVNNTAAAATAAAGSMSIVAVMQK